MQYKILEIDADKKTVKIEVTFDDGEVYTKRMMANVTSKETVTTAIEAWLVEYIPARQPKVSQVKEVSDMVGKLVSISKVDMDAKIAQAQEDAISIELAPKDETGRK